MELKKTIKCNNFSFYLNHVRIINVLLNGTLTEAEAEVLAMFLSENEPFSKNSRKNITERLKLSPQGLANYIRFLVSKKFILRETADNGKAILKLNDKIKVSDPKNQTYILTLNNEDTGDL